MEAQMVFISSSKQVGVLSEKENRMRSVQSEDISEKQSVVFGISLQ